MYYLILYIIYIFKNFTPINMGVFLTERQNRKGVNGSFMLILSHTLRVLTSIRYIRKNVYFHTRKLL